MTALEIASLVVEVISWIALGTGLVILACAGVFRLVDGSWEPVDLVVVDGDGGASARWFAEDEFWDRSLKPAERERVDDAEEHRAFFRRGDAGRMRFERVHPGLKVTGMLGFVLTGVGVLALIASFVLLFLH
ncbi:hypothetical protein [Agromyces archimandritae]|uniref:Uncharacterized protein n=1 Tax=Agromyces archimandritae TaxID=2781962 RepID=A0A975IP53_9MICO|nr:hypothetical protein [Agromyces archimandritae]QTX03606.1 hypothetical protein G127AT_09640 [Agromyces archimandritae]